MPYNVTLKKNEEKRIMQGESWVYANECAKIEAVGDSRNGGILVSASCTHGGVRGRSLKY